MIDVVKKRHKLPAINLAKLIRLYDAVWGASTFPAQAWGGGVRVGVEAGAGKAHRWPEGTDGELGRYPALETVEAAMLLDCICLPQTAVLD